MKLKNKVREIIRRRYFTEISYKLELKNAKAWLFNYSSSGVGVGVVSSSSSSVGVGVTSSSD